MSLLSPHFTLAEMCASQTAKSRGIDNTPGPAVVMNLERLCVELEKVRTLTGKPLKIQSGYRCAALNTVVGGQPTSYHMVGCAADFDPPDGWTHDQLQHAIAAQPDIAFDLVLEEKARDGAHWLHAQIARPGSEPRHLIKDADLAHQGGAISRVSAG